MWKSKSVKYLFLMVRNSTFCIVLAFFLTLTLIGDCQGKVLELSDRFLPLRHEGMWFVMVS